VVYRRAAGAVEVALGEQVDRLSGARTTRLPKGKPDPGESLEEAALREVHEEAGLTARLASPLGSISYEYREGKERVAKQVHFYLMELVAEGAPCDGELERVFWCPLGEAEARLSFGTERDILARARALLEG
jgi:8-oxo-dGTP pyrophosphatase MutT (NUDIX family)